MRRIVETEGKAALPDPAGDEHIRPLGDRIESRRIFGEEPLPGRVQPVPEETELPAVRMPRKDIIGGKLPCMLLCPLGTMGEQDADPLAFKRSRAALFTVPRDEELSAAQKRPHALPRDDVHAAGRELFSDLFMKGVPRLVVPLGKEDGLERGELFGKPERTAGGKVGRASDEVARHEDGVRLERFDFCENASRVRRDLGKVQIAQMDDFDAVLPLSEREFLIGDAPVLE